jgi:hypothetical protein
MTLTLYTIRELMAHSSRDSSEVQSIKRLWWNLRDMRRAFPTELIDHSAIDSLMIDLQSLVIALTHGKKALTQG